MDWIPGTGSRVPLHTSETANRRIREATSRRLEEIGHDRNRIERRMQELEQEWDIERVLEANAALLAITGVLLGATVHRRWFLLPGVVGGFLLQHAVQGWCPPLPILRRFGVRTASEIERERWALKALRGDFNGVSPATSPRELMKLH